MNKPRSLILFYDSSKEVALQMILHSSDQKYPVSLITNSVRLSQKDLRRIHAWIGKVIKVLP